VCITVTVKCGNIDSSVIACSHETSVNKSNPPIQNPSKSHAPPTRDIMKGKIRYPKFAYTN
jgi:hypothetical protein